jgi:hypothetical protein
MSDTDIVVDAPDVHSNTDYASPVTSQIKEAAWQAIQNDKSGDDATDFVEESRDRAAEEAGEELPPNRKQARRDRFARALEAAREAERNPVKDTRDALELAADEDDEPRHEEPRDHQREHEEHEARQRQRDEMVATTAKYEMRAAAFEQAVPDYKETIQAVFGVFPPQESVADALLKSPVGPELAYRLSQDLDAIEELNALPPAEAARRLAVAEGVLLARQQQSAPPPRRVTKAPRPISAVRGGAGPGFDPVKSNDMDAFADWLKKDQAKRAGR